MLRHSAATEIETSKIGSTQRECPMLKHPRKSSINRKTAPHLPDPQNVLICDALSCQNVQTSLRKNKELRPASDFSPSMFLTGMQALFRTNFFPLPRVARFFDVITCKHYLLTSNSDHRRDVNVTDNCEALMEIATHPRTRTRRINILLFMLD